MEPLWTMLENSCPRPLQCVQMAEQWYWPLLQKLPERVHIDVTDLNTIWNLLCIFAPRLKQSQLTVLFQYLIPNSIVISDIMISLSLLVNTTITKLSMDITILRGCLVCRIVNIFVNKSKFWKSKSHDLQCIKRTEIAALIYVMKTWQEPRQVQKTDPKIGIQNMNYRQVLV